MEELLRTKSGAFTLENSYTLSQVEEAVKDGSIEGKIISIEEVLAEYPAVHCTSEGRRLLDNGNPLGENLVQENHKDGWVRMYTQDGVFTALYEWQERRQQYFPVKMF